MTLPVSLDQAKDQLRIIGSDQDPEIENFILDAAGWVESYTGHILEVRTFTAEFSAFERLDLANHPVVPGSVSVRIMQDGFDPLTVLSALDAGRRPARLRPIGSAWPALPSGATVQVVYEAGYSRPDEVPRNFVRAMLILITAYDADREGGEILEAAEAAAQRLCRRYRRATL